MAHSSSSSCGRLAASTGHSDNGLTPKVWLATGIVDPGLPPSHARPCIPATYSYTLSHTITFGQVIAPSSHPHLTFDTLCIKALGTILNGVDLVSLNGAKQMKSIGPLTATPFTWWMLIHLGLHFYNSGNASVTRGFQSLSAPLSFFLNKRHFPAIY